MSKWIKVSDKLPEKWVRVAILMFDDNEPIISHIDKRSYFDARSRTFYRTIWVGAERQVTHWTPLPKPPKEKDK